MTSTAVFSTKTYGKWILAGEHAVLRGVPALVFPTTSSAMKFEWQPTDSAIEAEFSGPNGSELELLFWGLLENALHASSHTRADLKGHLKITSDIPLGAGLGGSAAICVGVGRLCEKFGFINNSEVYEFSRQLENLFHGESSGVDIAVALEGRGLKFMRGGERSPLTPVWRPKLYLSYSGKRGVTSECVKRVNELRAQSKHLGDKLDAQMREAVERSEKALLDHSAPVDELAKALDLARDCFYQWGLCEGVLDQHMRELLRVGAISVKPTGSGGGGHVLSLWDSIPPEGVSARLISLM